MGEGVDGFSVLAVGMYRFACHMAHRADIDSFRPANALPIAAIIHASAALEAFLNEETEVRLTNDRNLQAAIRAMDRVEFENRWLIVPQLLFGRTFDNASEPFQSFHALIGLRNALVHYKPAAQSREKTPKFVGGLESRFEFSKANAPAEFGNVDLTWDQKVLNGHCARWACLTARDMVLKWHDLAGSPKLLRIAEWQWSIRYLEGLDAGEPPDSVMSVQL